MYCEEFSRLNSKYFTKCMGAINKVKYHPKINPAVKRTKHAVLTVMVAPPSPQQLISYFLFCTDKLKMWRHILINKEQVRKLWKRQTENTLVQRTYIFDLFFKFYHRSSCFTTKNIHLYNTFHMLHSTTFFC